MGCLPCRAVYRRPELGRFPWFALLRRERSLRLAVFLLMRSSVRADEASGSVVRARNEAIRAR